ncbi:LuxR C-terminal-related transcriptional regulator [Saccharomonospora azurea]|uniref:helix-turn-helix transcriptional regulator n=1 Tax=Saccharomonospora azurea TaxID=40988 RepID=UPI0033238B46
MDGRTAQGSTETESSRHPGPSSTAPRGREGEWGRLTDALAHVSEGHTMIAVVDGPPGSGKTSMLGRLLQHAHRVGFGVRQPMLSRHHAVPRQYSPVGGDLRVVVGPKQTHISSLDWDHGHLPETTLPTLVGHAPQRAPMLVMCDDADRVDDRIIGECLDILAGSTERGALLVLTRCTARLARGEGTRLQGLLHSTPYPQVHLRLEPLPETVVTSLATERFGAPPCPGLQSMLVSTGGNPELVDALLGGLRDEGLIDVGETTASASPERVPHRVRSLAAVRLARLSDRCRRMLTVMSVVDTPLRVYQLASLLGESSTELLDVLQEALDSELLRSEDHRLVAAQQLVVRTLADELAPTVRRAILRDAGLLLRDSPEARDAAATHLLRAADTGDEPVLEAMTDLARRLARDQPARAAELALGVLRLTGEDDDAYVERVRTAVNTLMAAGRMSEAAELARCTLARPLDPETNAELRSTLANLLLMSGQTTEVTDEAEATLEERAAPAVVRQTATAAKIYGAFVREGAGSEAEARRILAAGSGGVGSMLAGTVLANVLWERGVLGEALTVARNAVAAVSHGTPPVWRPQPKLALAEKLVDLRESAEAEAVIRDLDAEIDRYGLAGQAAAPKLVRAELLLHTGRVPEAQELARDALRTVRNTGTFLLQPRALAVLALASLRGGDPIAAAGHVEEFAAAARDGVGFYRAPLEWIELQVIHARHGEHSAAAEALRRYRTELTTRRGLFVAEPGAGPWLIRLALRLGERELAHTLFDVLCSLSDDNPGFTLLGTAARHAQGLLDADAAALRQAVAEHRDPWAAAWAAEDLGTLLARTGAPGDATLPLEDALRRFERIGCRHDAARLRSKLRELGVYKRPAPSTTSDDSGWDCLDDTERTIATLVSQGLTNRQIAKQVFLSSSTVNYHLRKMFRKLGINSRVELAGFAHAGRDDRGD